MWVVLGSFLVGLAFHGEGFSLLVDGVLGVSALWLPAVVCVASLTLRHGRRPEIVLAAAASVVFAVGNTYYVAGSHVMEEVPFPSYADIGYLGFPALMMCAVVVASRRNLNGLSSALFLDSAVGSLAAASAAAVVLAPVLESAARASPCPLPRSLHSPIPCRTCSWSPRSPG